MLALTRDRGTPHDGGRRGAHAPHPSSSNAVRDQTRVPPRAAPRRRRSNPRPRVTPTEMAAALLTTLAAVPAVGWVATRVRRRWGGRGAGGPEPRPPLAPAPPAPTGEFSTRMGHELRTPLNSVIGFSSVLLKNPRGNLSPQQLLYLSRIRDNGVHLLALVDHLVDASDQHTGAQRVRLTPVSVERIVRGAVQELATEAALDHVTLETEIPNGILPLTTDEHRFAYALRSLVRGAYPLAGDGNLTVRVAAPDGRPVRIDVDVTGPAVVREPAPGAALLPPAQVTLAASLYHLLGYPVTTGSSATSRATFSVMLAPVAPPPAGAAAPPATTIAVPGPIQ